MLVEATVEMLAAFSPTGLITPFATMEPLALLATIALSAGATWILARRGIVDSRWLLVAESPLAQAIAIVVVTLLTGGALFGSMATEAKVKIQQRLVSPNMPKWNSLLPSCAKLFIFGRKPSSNLGPGYVANVDVNSINLPLPDPSTVDWQPRRGLFRSFYGKCIFLSIFNVHRKYCFAFEQAASTPLTSPSSRWSPWLVSRFGTSCLVVRPQPCPLPPTIALLSRGSTTRWGSRRRRTSRTRRGR